MYYYHVKYLTEEPPYDIEESGVIGAASYKEATARLTEYYNENRIVSMTLESWDDILTMEDIRSCEE